METNQQQPAKDSNPDVKSQNKVPGSAHVMCGWPLLLVAIGGAIGGALGGVAYGINVAIYKSKLPVAAKVLLNLLTGFVAIGLWAAIAVAISDTIGPACLSVRSHHMTRLATFWSLVIGLCGIPFCILALYHARAIYRTRRAICADLKKEGIELSKADLRLLLVQLKGFPKAVLAPDSCPVSRAIKERHVEKLVADLKTVHILILIVIAVGIALIWSFQYLWPFK